MAHKAEQSGDKLGPAQGHGHQDFNLGYLVWFGIGLLALVVLANVVSYWMFLRFEDRQQQLDRPLSPLAEPSPLPPGPRLQVAPEVDLQQMRAGEMEMLNSYGWVDRQAGIIRVPIDRAMELLLQQGLPARNAEPPGEAEPRP
jgi:hypothetical protein